MKMRNSPAVMLIVFVTLILAIGLILYFLIASDSANEIEKPEGGRGANAGDAGSISGIDGSAHPDHLDNSPASKRETDLKNAQEVEFSTSQVSTIKGPDEFPTAVSFFKHIADTHNLDLTEMSSELSMWQHICGKTRTPKNNFYPEFGSKQYRPIMEKFESFCSGIDETAELAEIENLAQNIDTLLDGEPRASPFDDLDKLGTERGLDLIFDKLETALERMSRPAAQVVIMNLFSSGLYPAVEESGINSRFSLLSIAPSTAFSLVCQQLGNCRGIDHPFVIAYCIETYTAMNRLCDAPGSMPEAINQTLTPIEHQQYLALLSWVNAELTKRRANEAG